MDYIVLQEKGALNQQLDTIAKNKHIIYKGAWKKIAPSGTVHTY